MSLEGFGVTVPFYSIEKTIRLAKAVDESGFDFFSIPEMPNDNSAIIKAAAVASQTKNTKIAIGVLNPYLRHLSSIAADAMGLDELSHGRFMLGLGIPVWKMAVYGFTVKNLRPLETMREAYIILKDLVSGRPTSIKSEFFGIPKGMQMTVKPVPTNIPIFFGVINKLLLRLAGEIADYVQLGAVTHPGYVKWAVKQIRVGAQRVGRDPHTIPIHGNVMTCLDDDPQKARDMIKPQLSWYLNFLEKVMFTGTDIGEKDLAPIKEAFASGRSQEAIHYVSDKILDTMTVVGDTEDCIRGLRRFIGTGLTHPIIFGPIGADDAETVRRLAAEVIPAVL
ncbi:MAG: LLM class flavin-dependent oxidoreductase [Candidatus Ranarchaeia archaeon]